MVNSELLPIHNSRRDILEIAVKDGQIPVIEK